MDPFVKFKEAQKQSWSHFAPLENSTMTSAAHLVRHARVRAGQRVLDVGCGTGVAAITAASTGAHVTAVDLTPALLEHARENGRIAGATVEWHEGDAEALPFEAGAFDVVLSQFGHMFAPRPDVAVSEMLRVLKPGGTIAFSTWPPELFVGQTFILVGRYLPPPPPGVAPPPLWGEPSVIRERLGSAVKDIAFDMDRMLAPALSAAHFRLMFERTAGPVIRVVETLTASDPERLAEFRRETEALIGRFWRDNVVHQDFLMTRATKI